MSVVQLLAYDGSARTDYLNLHNLHFKRIPIFVIVRMSFLSNKPLLLAALRLVMLVTFLPLRKRSI